MRTKVLIHITTLSFILKSAAIIALVNNEAESEKYKSELHPEYIYTSWMKSLPVPYCQPSEPMRYPKSHKEVVSIVKEAIALGKTVKAIGTTHSATDVICTDGIPINMIHITGMRLNSDKTVTVGAGTTFRSVCEYLESHGLALLGIPAYGNITIGGAIGSGAHGSTIKHPSTISETAIEFLIVDGLGEIRRIGDPDDLKAFRLHLGLLGVILEVTLPTVDFYKVKAHNVILPENILTNGVLLKLLKTTDQLTVYWFPTYEQITLSTINFVNPNTPGDAWTNDHVPDVTAAAAYTQKHYLTVAQKRNSTEALNLLQASTGLQLSRKFPGYPLIYTEDGENVKNPAVGSYYKMIAPVCHHTGRVQCAWLHGENGLRFLIQEFSIDLHRLRELIPIVKDILARSPAVFPLQGILLRFSGKQDTYMATCRRGPVCNFEFYIAMRDDPYNTASVGLAAYQAITQTLLYKFNGQPHWGKTAAFYHSRQAMTKYLHPEARTAFLKKMTEYDPNGIFLNAFGRRLQGIDTIADIDPKVKHCALLDSCVCAVNDDCAPGQKCSRIKGYPKYPVCKYPGNDKLSPALDLTPLRRYFDPLFDRINEWGVRFRNRGGEIIDNNLRERSRLY